MDKFEGQIIGYMLNQARMPFFVVGAYPHYRIENESLVRDNGSDSKAIRAQANEAYDLIRRIQDRVKRGVRIPRTWTRTLEGQVTFVMALEQQRVATKEWCEEFYRAVRWLKTLTA